MIFLASVDLMFLIGLLTALCATFFQLGRGFERALLGATTRKNDLDK